VKRGFGEVGVSLGYDPFRIKEEKKEGMTMPAVHAPPEMQMQEETVETRVRNFILGGNISYNNPGGLIALLEGFLLRDLESNSPLLRNNGFRRGLFALVQKPGEPYSP
jgi:hypothetical protein